MKTRTACRNSSLNGWIASRGAGWLLGALWIVFALGLAGCDSSKKSDSGGAGGSGGTVAPYTGSVTVSILDDSATVTWSPAAGESYNIRYGSYTVTGGGGGGGGSTGTLANGSPLTASPATVTINLTGSVYVWITRVSGSSESDATGATVAYVYNPSSVYNFSGSSLTLSGSAVVLASNWYPNTSFTSLELYRLSTANSAISGVTPVSSGASASALSDPLTAFVDASGVPLTYHYALAVVNTSTTNVARRTAWADFSPTLSALSILPSGYTGSTYLLPSSSYGGSIAVTSGGVFWTCQTSSTNICALATGGSASYPTVANPSGLSTSNYITKIATNASGSTGTVYYITSSASGQVGGMAVGGSGVTGYAPVTSPSALAIDSTYVYVGTGTTTVSRIAQSALTTTSAAFSSQNSTPLAGLRDMVLSGTTLYLATDAGIQTLTTGPAGNAPVTLFGTTYPVKALAVDGTNSKLYYLAQSTNPSYPGADAIWALSFATCPGSCSSSVLQDRVYGAKNLQYRNGSLYWNTYRQVYQYNLTTSTLTRRAEGAIAVLAANSDGSAYTGVSGAAPLYLPAAYAYAAAVPAAATAPTLMSNDQNLFVQWTMPSGADAVQVSKGGAFHSLNFGTSTSTLSLTNGTAYTIAVAGLNASDAGTAASAAGTPKVAKPYLVQAIPKSGAVDFRISNINPSSRSLLFSVFKGNAQPVATTTAAISTSAAVSLGSAYTTLTLPGQNDGTLFYYNVNLVDGASTSDAYFSANSEGWTNSAAAAATATLTSAPSYVVPTMVSSAGTYVYWSYAGSTPNKVYRSNTGTTLPNVEQATSTTITILDALTSQSGVYLFGYDKDAGVPAAYVVNNANNSNQSLATATAILSSSVAGASTFSNSDVPSAIMEVSGTLYVGTLTGKIFAVDWSGSVASNQRLVQNTGGGAICELGWQGSDIYWSQDASASYANANGCPGVSSFNYNTSGRSSRLQRGPMAGGGTVDTLVTISNNAFTHFQVSMSGNLYYTSGADTNFIHRLNVSTLTGDTPVAEQTFGYFAVVSGTPDKLYFTGYYGDGVIYTLDSQNRRLALATLGGTAYGISVFQISLVNKVFLYGSGGLYMGPSVP